VSSAELREFFGAERFHADFEAGTTVSFEPAITWPIESTTSE
jgi:hypothetical protein